MICPNKTSASYKILEKYFTEQEIYEIFVGNEYAMPDEIEAHKIVKNRSAVAKPVDLVETEKKFKLRNADGSRKRFLEKNYTNVVNKVRELNSKNPDLNFSVIKVMGEKGDNRVYYSIKVETNSQEQVSLYPKAITESSKSNINVLLDNQNEFIKELGVDQTIQLVNYSYNKVVAALEQGESYDDTLFGIKADLVFKRDTLKTYLDKPFTEAQKVKIQQGIDRYSNAIDNWGKIENLINHELNKTKGLELEEEGLDNEVKGDVYGKESYEIDPKTKVSAKLKILLSGIRKPDPKASQIAKARYVQDKVKEGLSQEAAETSANNLSDYELYTYLPEDDKYATTWFGQHELIDFNAAYKLLLPILAGENENMETIIRKLENEVKTELWLVEVIEKLKRLDKQTSNQFASQMTKHELDMRYVQINSKKVKVGGKTVEYYNTFVRRSNQNEISQLIHEAWETNFIDTNILDSSGDDYVFNKQAVNTLKDQYDALISSTGKVYRMVVGFTINSKEDYEKFKDLPQFKEQVERTKGDNIVPIVKMRGASFIITDEGLVPKPSATLDVQTILDIYNSVGIKLSEQTAKSLSYKRPAEILQPIQYILEHIFENIDGKYYEDNLQPLNQEGVKKLAKLESKYSPLRAFSPDNFRTQGKQIYAYTMKNFLTERAKQLKNNPALISKLRGTAYHGNSVHLQYLDVNSPLYNTEEGKKFRDSFDTIEDFDLQVLKDLQATVKWGDQRFTRVDEISQEVAVLGLFVNSNTKGDNRIARFVMPTFSDKTRSAIVPFVTTKVTYENDTISDDMVNTIYNRIVMPEIKRIAHWTTLTEIELNHKQYKDGGRFFYSLPELNELNVNGSNLFNIIKSKVEMLGDDFKDMETFGLGEDVEAVIKDYVKSYVNNSILEKLAKWKSYEMVTEKEVQFDLNYLKTLINTTSDTLSQEQLDKALKLLAADFKVNDMLAKAEMHYMFIGDPAMMYKGGRDSDTVVNAIENNQPVNTWSVIYETYTNIGKRLALEIATGKKPANNESEVYIQLMMEDPQLASSTMSYLASVLDGKEFNHDSYTKMSKDEKKAFIKGFENSGDFLKIDGADAQEFTTMKEWLHTMIQFGDTNLTDKEVAELLEIESKPNPTLTEIQRLRDTIISVSKQPQKPVYSGQIYDATLNAMNIVYVKSSAFPLSRHLTKDFQIDNLRILMENLEAREGKFVRASFESANKLGSVNRPLKVFNDNGDVRSPEEMMADINNPLGLPIEGVTEEIARAYAPYRELDRFNFRIQQENPVKEKGYIKRGTQETKLLWLNILGEPGMRDLYEEYLENYRQLYDEGRTDLFKELGLDLDVPLTDQKINLNKLSALLKKEAKERNYPLQDVKGLDVVGNNFVMPLMFHASSNRYESLLNSVINNRILAVKMPGSGYILGTAEGFRLKEVETYGIPEGTIFTSAWTGELTNAHFIDKSTGKPITKKIEQYNPDNIEFVPAKVLAPSKFTIDGKIVKVRDLAIEKNGRLYLDETKIDKSILKLFGFRIPTSGQMSMASIEIAGFLPEDVGDLLIAPRDFTKQMGSDFDVDKLMTYHYELEMVEGKLVRKDSKKNRIIEIHHKVLSSKSSKIQEQILKPLSFDVAKDQAKLIQTQSGKKWSMLDDEYQKMKRVGGSSGKSGTGWYSLAVTFHATMQQLPVPVQVMTVVDEEKVPYNLTIAGLTSDGRLGREKTLGGGKRYISEVHIQRQNYSVDNEKEQLMFPLNDNNFTFHFNTFMDELGFDLVKVNGVEISLTDFIRTQPVIQEYVALRNLDKSEEEAYDTLLQKYDSVQWQDIVSKPQFAEELLNGTANQAAVLGLFMEASSFGDSMAKVMVAYNTDSGGLGKSIFDNLDKLDKIAEIEQEGRFVGIRQIRNNTINGLATTYGLDTTRVLNDLFPYDKFKPIFERLAEAIGAELTVEDKQDTVKEFRKFIFASHLIQQLEENYDIETLRNELFFQTDTTTSLAKYVRDLKQNGQLNSSLFSLMSTEVNENSLPSTIKWNNSVREDNENKYYFDWLSMFLDESSLPPYNGREMSYQSLAQILVTYAYLEGGIQEATQFIKHVPIEYLKGVGFDKSLRDINFNDPTTFGYDEAFLRQFIQHNPMKVKFKYTPDEIFKAIDGNSKDINKLTSFTLKEDYKPEFIRVYNNKTDIQNRKIRKKGAVLLFMKMDDGKYYKIPVLGIHGMNEYNFDKKGAIKSLVDSYNKNTVFDTAFVGTITASQPTGELFEKGATLESLLTKVTKSNNPYYAKLAKFYLDNLGNLDITLVFKSAKAGDAVPGRGWYDNFTKEIGFDRDIIRKLLLEGNLKDVEKLILHEFTHAFTIKYLDANIIPEALAPHILKLQRLFKIVERQYPNIEAFRENFKKTKLATLEETEDIYGGYNILEFVSLIMTEPKFQEKMSKIPSGETTLWDRIANAFADLIRELLDFAGFNKDSITTEAMASIVNLVTYKPETAPPIEELPDAYWDSMAEEEDSTLDIEVSSVNDIYSQLGNKTQSENVVIDEVNGRKPAVENDLKAIALNNKGKQVSIKYDKYKQPFNAIITGKIEQVVSPTELRYDDGRVEYKDDGVYAIQIETNTGKILTAQLKEITGLDLQSSKPIVAYRTRGNNFLEALEKDNAIGNPWSHLGSGQNENLTKKNLFTVKPIQSVDKKAVIKASIATQYIGFGEGISNSSTELYRQQVNEEYSKAVKEANSRPSTTNIPQNLQSGVEQYGTLQYANNEAQKVLGKNVTSIEMIENGFRTRTTRTDKELEKYDIKVGSYIKMFGKDQFGNTKNVIVKITKITKGYDDTTWYKEGWTEEGLQKLKDHTNSANAVEFQVIKPANSGNYSSNDVIFVSVGGKRGNEIVRKQQQDRTIKEALKAIEAGATLITDNKSYVESSDYNEGEKRLAKNLESKGYSYSEQTIDGQLLGVWTKNQYGLYKTNTVKEGVQELFESNPELANNVYEALGFEKESNIEILTSNYTRQSVQNDTDTMYLFTDNAQRTSRPTATEENVDKDSWYYKKYKSQTDKPIHFGSTSNPTSAIIRGLNNAYPISTMSAYGTNWTDSNFELFKQTIDDEIAQIKQDLPKFKTLKIGNFRIGQGGKFARLPKPLQEYLDAKLLEIGIDNTGDKPKIISTQITPQQKQQAQLVYSQYLDSIFPDSKVKDIVYHGTDAKFDKFDKNFIKKDGVNSFGDKFYFLPKDMLHMIFKGQRIIPVLLNMKSYTDYFEQGTYETNNNIRRFEEGILEELAVNEPEQIHILSSKEDIEGFKKYVKSISVKNQYGLYKTTDAAPQNDMTSGLNDDFSKWDKVVELSPAGLPQIVVDLRKQSKCQ